MKELIFAITVIASQHTFAAGVDIWEGAGSLFDLKGNPTESYNLVVENTKNGPLTQSNVSITLLDGSVRKQQCLMTETKPGDWDSECDNGKGGGHCFGDGLCISYIEDSTGKAYATTIAMDGPSDMRLLRTELQNGKAVRFFREKLHKR